MGSGEPEQRGRAVSWSNAWLPCGGQSIGRQAQGGGGGGYGRCLVGGGRSEGWIQDGFIDGNLKDVWLWWGVDRRGVKDAFPACGLGSRVGEKDCWEGHGGWPWGL